MGIVAATMNAGYHLTPRGNYIKPRTLFNETKTKS